MADQMVHITTLASIFRVLDTSNYQLSPTQHQVPLFNNHIKMKQARPANTSTTLPVVRCWKGVPPSIHGVRCHFGRMLCGNWYLCLQFLKAFSFCFCPDFRPRISSLLLFPLLLTADGPFASECRIDEMSQTAR